MMDDPAEARQLGDYRLKERLRDQPRSTTWLAEQVSVSRAVLLDELRDDELSNQAIFLADVRAKAAVDHPLIGSVYEAVAEPGRCFYAYELLPGETLAEIRDCGKRLAPSRMTRLLHRICEANLYYESHDRASAPISLEAIHFNEHDVVRVCNLATAGSRTPEQSVRDITHLGRELVPLVEEGKPGSTRMLTLLAWMRGKELPQPLHWLEIINLCEQIDQQLSGPLPPATATLAEGQRVTKRPIALLAVITGIALLAVLVLAMRMRPVTPAKVEKTPLPAPVLIAAATHPTPDGAPAALPGFRISAHETTIGEYAAFLETLNILAADGREKIFDHPEQPAEKASHLPDDWDALLAAANSGSTWKGTSVNLDSPVIGVDWWDATAYAEWKQGRLPTQEEWHAALLIGEENPQTIPTSLWVPVNGKNPDRTGNGLLAMAGSLAEWTRVPATNPSNPLGKKLWVIIGGSHMKAGSNALTREWVDDRSLRRADLGFRVVWNE